MCQRSLFKLDRGENMLLQFSCANFKSIKEKVIFSAVASKDDQYEERLIPIGKIRVLRTALIYGANGSGKSNFLDSIGFMQSLVRNSINHQPGQGIYQAPHKLAEKDMPSEFSIQFIRHGLRYAYGLSVLNNTVKEEYLYFFPKGKQVKIFEREGMDVTPGDKYKKGKPFELSLTVLKENRLFLSCAANYSRLKEVEDAFLFFAEDIVVYNREMNNWTEYSVKLMQENEQVRRLFVNMLREFKTGIKDIRVKLEPVSTSDIATTVPPQIKQLLPAEGLHKVDAKVIYDQFETDLFTEESDGIKKLFELLCPIIDILIKGKILICDELESNLHETLVSKIVELFQSIRGDTPAQMFFSTHDTSLLNKNLFRRDQIWLTEMTEDRATDLYSLVELKNVRKTENMERGYINGKYGAIPMMNPDFVKTLADSI